MTNQKSLKILFSGFKVFMLIFFISALYIGDNFGQNNSASVIVQATNLGAPTNLRVQDNNEQLGVDVPNPNFAWFVNDNDRGEKQTAYRIIVASNQRNIDENKGDIWERPSQDRYLEV